MKTTLENIRISRSSSSLPTHRHATPALGLNRHDVVEGQVVRSVPPNHAVLAIRGEQVMAQTNVPLKAGDLVSFKVLQVDPQYILKVVEWIGKAPPGANECLKWCDLSGFPYKSLLDLFSPFMGAEGRAANRDMPEPLQKLWRLFRDISVAPDRGENAGSIKNVLENSGLLWEGKLRAALKSLAKGASQMQLNAGRDLKGSLLNTISNWPGSDPIGVDSLRKCLDGLEQLQLLNVSAMEDKGKCLFVIPLRYNGEFTFAQFLLHLPDRSDQADGKRSKKGTYGIRLLLDMSVLGPVHVDASVLEKVIKIDFLVSDNGVKERFEHGAARLTEALAESGFHVKQVRCRCVDSENTIPTSLVDDMLDQARHHISLIV